MLTFTFPVGNIWLQLDMHEFDAHIWVLICIHDMDANKVYLNNVTNHLGSVASGRQAPVARIEGLQFLL